MSRHQLCSAARKAGAEYRAARTWFQRLTTLVEQWLWKQQLSYGEFHWALGYCRGKRDSAPPGLSLRAVRAVLTAASAVMESERLRVWEAAREIAGRLDDDEILAWPRSKWMDGWSARGEFVAVLVSHALQ